MDKNIWLKVIRQELGLLDQLASGMIEDSNLTKEEVELALTRSKVVVSEFEMLLQQMTETNREVAKPKNPVVEVNSPEIMTETEVEVNQVIKQVVSSEVSLEAAEEPRKAEKVRTKEVEPSAQIKAPVAEPITVREEKSEPNLLYDEQKEAVSQFKATPLKSLKEGLSLNDRYLFQRELFDNDKLKLDETVSALDRLSNIKEAVDYLKSNFKWAKNEASEKFVQLVKRRFS